MRGNFAPLSVKELTAFPYNENQKKKKKKHIKENKAQKNCTINAHEENQNIISHIGKVLQRIITLVAMMQILIHRLMTTTNNLRVLCL